MLAISLLVAVPAAAGVGAARTSPHEDDPLVTTVTVTTAVASSYRGLPAERWAARFRKRTRQLQVARHTTKRLQAVWHPTVDYALRLASAVTGVSYWQLRSVSYCESTHNPFASNGRYKGLFQLGWSPFGFSPYDPVANALSAAMTVRHDGSWRQWECSP